MALISLNLAIHDGEPTLDLQVDTNDTVLAEDSPPEFSEEQTEEALDAIEKATGRDMRPDSATISDDAVIAEDPEVIEIEREGDDG